MPNMIEIERANFAPAAAKNGRNRRS